jgi:hypothetical protein
VSDISIGGGPVSWTHRPEEAGTEEAGTAEAGTATRAAPDVRRVLQLALAGIWVLDGVLQYQSAMFTKSFGQMLGATASGNPVVIAGPIRWDAHLVEHHTAALNAVFATTQLLIGLGIACRPTARLALGASIAWSLAVWWLGEGFGGVLSGAANPVSGAPGAVILYALLAVLLWPADRAGRPPPFTAARAVGAPAARAMWLVLWASLAYFAVTPANRAPQGLHDMIAGMASGEPRWLAALDRSAAALVAHQGLAASIALAVAFALIAVGVYLPARAARSTLVLALVVAAVLWVVGQALGGMLSGSATDPNSGLLLALLALTYWSARRPPRDAGQVAA